MNTERGYGWHPNLTRPCQPGCQCGKHNRTKLHNELISIGVRRALEEKKATNINLLRTDCGPGRINK
jgi:hypothetical protein